MFMGCNEKLRYPDCIKYKGQLIIRDFGKDKYDSPLFFPNSVEWQKLQKK